MREKMLETEAKVRSGAPPPRPGAVWLILRRRAWLSTAVGLILVSALLLLWARTRPGYDPYGWLVWGSQTLHLSLNLGGAPSWKPLPYLFTIPYALAGHFELWLWMLTAAAVSLAGSVFGGRIAYRVIAAELNGAGVNGAGVTPPIRRYAPVAAAIFAGVAVLGLEDYSHYILSVQSDPMIVSCCLAAIDMHLCGRHRWAFALGVLGALGRPEVWPFLGLYGVWAWFKRPAMRWSLVGGTALIAFMWFGIPWITNGRPDIAGQLALRSPRELHSNRVAGTIGRFTELEYLPVWIAALAGVAIGVLRRNRVVLALAAAVAGWVVVEIAFALHGFPALPRYMFEAAAGGAVLAGIGVGGVLVELPRRRPGVPRWAGAVVVGVLLASLVPGALARFRAERLDLRHERGRTHEIAWLQTTIDRLGGYRHIRDCGEPVTDVEYASVLAWLTHLDVGYVGYRPSFEMRRRYPIVLFLPVAPGGWTVRPWHSRGSQRTTCSSLRAAYRLTGQHPSGVLVRN